jgi:hypothetical protein
VRKSGEGVKAEILADDLGELAALARRLRRR